MDDIFFENRISYKAYRYEIFHHLGTGLIDALRGIGVPISFKALCFVKTSLLEGDAVKNFVLLVMVAFVGCATTGNVGGGSSSGEAGSKLTDADLQKMGATHGGYGNSN